MRLNLPFFFLFLQTLLQKRDHRPRIGFFYASPEAQNHRSARKAISGERGVNTKCGVKAKPQNDHVRVYPKQCRPHFIGCML